jgi:hypothetical protein
MTQAFGDGNHQPSISDLVLQPQVILMTNDAADSSPATAEFSPAAAVQSNPSPIGNGVRQTPKTSLADLLLDNITYDAILASSAKSLHLQPGSLPSSDATHAPPNTPSSAEMTRYGSLASMAGTNVIESNADAGRSQL